MDGNLKIRELLLRDKGTPNQLWKKFPYRKERSFLRISKKAPTKLVALTVKNSKVWPWQGLRPLSRMKELCSSGTTVPPSDKEMHGNLSMEEFLGALKFKILSSPLRNISSTKSAQLLSGDNPTLIQTTWRLRTSMGTQTTKFLFKLGNVKFLREIRNKSISLLRPRSKPLHWRNRNTMQSRDL